MAASLLLLVLAVLALLVVGVVVAAVVVAVGRSGQTLSVAPVSAPVAKDRIDGWSDAVELRALDPAAGAVGTASYGDGERHAIEASAILATSGWHTAEQFLREQRGLSAAEAKALLDSLS